jgi:hypothetical protein
MTDINNSFNHADEASAVYAGRLSSLTMCRCVCAGNDPGGVLQLSGAAPTKVIEFLAVTESRSCGLLDAAGDVVGKTGGLVWLSGNYIINNSVFVNNTHQWIFQFPASGEHSLRLVRCSFDENITASGAAVPSIGEGVVTYMRPDRVAACTLHRTPPPTKSVSPSRTCTSSPPRSRTRFATMSPLESRTRSRSKSYSQSQSATPTPMFTDNWGTITQRRQLLQLWPFVVFWDNW